MKAKKNRQRLSAEMRPCVVKLVIAGGRKSSEAAVEHGIPVVNVYAWVRQAKVDAGDLKSSRGNALDRAEVDRLRKAFREREDELSFLKKELFSWPCKRKKVRGNKGPT